MPPYFRCICTGCISSHISSCINFIGNRMTKFRSNISSIANADLVTLWLSVTLTWQKCKKRNGQLLKCLHFFGCRISGSTVAAPAGFELEHSHRLHGQFDLKVEIFWTKENVKKPTSLSPSWFMLSPSWSIFSPFGPKALFFAFFEDNRDCAHWQAPSQFDIAGRLLKWFYDWASYCRRELFCIFERLKSN